MKGWCKIVSLDDQDVLVKKSYDVESHIYQVKTSTMRSNLEVVITLGYNDEEDRDRVYESLNEEFLKGLLKDDTWID